jgi:hypothetical protein
MDPPAVQRHVVAQHALGELLREIEPAGRGEPALTGAAAEPTDEVAPRSAISIEKREVFPSAGQGAEVSYTREAEADVFLLGERETSERHRYQRRTMSSVAGPDPSSGDDDLEAGVRLLRERAQDGPECTRVLVRRYDDTDQHGPNRDQTCGGPRSSPVPLVAPTPPLDGGTRRYGKRSCGLSRVTPLHRDDQFEAEPLYDHSGT